MTAERIENYYAVDIRPNVIEKLCRIHPHVKTIVPDCQDRLDFQDGYFDRIIAIHILEHLPDLPRAVEEVDRLCDKEFLQVVLLLEGSFTYGLGRRVSAQRIFEKRYGQPYKWFIEREHLNVPGEVIGEPEPYFHIRRAVCRGT